MGKRPWLDLFIDNFFAIIDLHTAAIPEYHVAFEPNISSMLGYQATKLQGKTELILNF